MNVTTVGQALAMEPNTALDCIAGTVLEVWPAKSGQGNYGPWTLQNVVLGDDDGAKIKVLFKWDALKPDAKGHRLYVIAGAGKMGKTVGLKTMLNTHDGVTTLQVQAADKCSVEFNDPSRTGQHARPAAPTAVQPALPATTAPTRQAAPRVSHDYAPEPDEIPFEAAALTPPERTVPMASRAPAAPTAKAGQSWEKVDGALLKMRRMYGECVKTAAVIHAEAAANGIQLGETSVQALATSLFIQCNMNALLITVPDFDHPSGF
jgi:hypothetical protein